MNIPSNTGQTGHDRHGRPSPPPAHPNAAPDETGEDDASGYGGASLVGSNVSGLDAARSDPAGTTHGHGRTDRRAEDGAPLSPALGAGTSVPDGLDTHTPGGVSTIGSGATGLNNYSPGSNLGVGLDSLGRASAGERASAGRGDGDRSSRDDGDSPGS